jgi:hypothetical protein
MCNLISVYLETLLVLVVLVQGLHQTYHSQRNHFGYTRWYSLVKSLKRKLISVRLEIVFVLVQDRCTVYAECTTCTKIILDAPNGAPR